MGREQSSITSWQLGDTTTQFAILFPSSLHSPLLGKHTTLGILPNLILRTMNFHIRDGYCFYYSTVISLPDFFCTTYIYISMAFPATPILSNI
jgi:hypothetical protein